MGLHFWSCQRNTPFSSRIIALVIEIVSKRNVFITAEGLFLLCATESKTTNHLKQNSPLVLRVKQRRLRWLYLWLCGWLLWSFGSPWNEGSSSSKTGSATSSLSFSFFSLRQQKCETQPSSKHSAKLSLSHTLSQFTSKAWFALD